MDLTKTLLLWKYDQDTKEVQQYQQIKFDLGAQTNYKVSDIYFSNDFEKISAYFVEVKRQAACLVEYSLTDGKVNLIQHKREEIYSDRQIGDSFVKKSVKDNFIAQITRDTSDKINVPLKQFEIFAKL